MLTRDQIIQSVNSLEEQGASQAEIQEWLNQIPRDVEKEPGFIQSAVRAMVNPVLRVAYTGAKFAAGVKNAGVALKSAVTGDSEGVRGAVEATEQLKRKSLKLPYLGEIRALGESGDLKTDIKDAVGTGLEIGSNLPFGRGLFSGVKAGVKAATEVGAKSVITGAMKRGAVEGAIGGATFATGAALEEDRPWYEVATQGAIGLAGGGLFGSLTGGLFSGLGVAVQKARVATNPEFRSQQIEVLERRVADELSETLNPNATQQNLERKSGKDAALFLAKEGVPLKVEGNKLDATEAIELLSRKAEAENSAFERVLADDQVSLDFNRARTMALRMVDEIGTARDIATRRINSEFEALGRQLRKSGVMEKSSSQIPKLVANRIKRDAWKKGKFNVLATPDEQTKAGASRLIGNAFKRLIEEGSDDADIRGMNARLGDLSEAIFMLEKRHGQPVKGGRLGRYFARTIGGIAGAQGGPVGSIAGAITADKLADILQDPNVRTWAVRQVLDRLKKNGQKSVIDEAEAILLKRNAVRAARPRLPSSTNAPIITPPPTTFEKGVPKMQ